jgi:hypothetical protein
MVIPFFYVETHDVETPKLGVSGQIGRLRPNWASQAKLGVSTISVQMQVQNLHLHCWYCADYIHQLAYKQAL